MKNLGYSQNFLVNKKLVERLISKSNIDVTDYVIEIGPGKGIITDVLSQHAGEVVAVEYDQELYNNLVRYHSHDNVTYIFGDFLKYKLPLNRRYKIFSNIPFQITADIIRKLTDDVNPPSDINIIIQREAAKKNCGIPLQKYEGFRAAIIKAQYKVEITHSFKRSDFFPSPNVDTVMLHMQLWDDRLSGDDLQNYKDLVAFFYTNIKGETAKERLSILFSNEQIKRLGKANRISLSNSYTLITAEQWMNIYLAFLLSDGYKRTYSSYISDIPVPFRLMSVQELTQYDMIAFCGGNAHTLLSEINRTGFSKPLKQAIENGLVYLGISAGSMIAAGNFSDGLGYLANPLIPHAEKESPFGDISKNDLIELADGQTVLIKGNRQEII